MELIFTNKIEQETEVIFYPVLEDLNSIKFLLKKLGYEKDIIINKKLKNEKFVGKKNQIFVISGEKQDIVLLGSGREKKLTIEDGRSLAGLIIVYLKKYYAKKVGLLVSAWLKGNNNIEQLGQALAEGLFLANYDFDKYKKIDKDGIKVDIRDLIVELKTNQKNKFKKGWEKGLLFAEGTIKARDLVNEPAGHVTPTLLAQVAQEIAKGDGSVSAKIMDKPAIEKLGMNAFLGVDRGSSEPPKLIHLIYKPKVKTKNKIALVGKGITFDSGGLNIKPGDSMAQMKDDMAGSASVLGLFSVISRLKPRAEVHGIIAACENMPSGSALKPGDVVKNMQGKTIEIGHTDAEGRVTLADSLAYAQKLGIKKIIDLATLTGACRVALGSDYAALFSNDDGLSKDLLKASSISGEKLWPLPMPEEYKILNKSNIADINNMPSSRFGGAITAALFLQEFIKEDVIWSHWDIASPAYIDKPMNNYIPAGGVGFGVRTLLEWLLKF